MGGFLTSNSITRFLITNFCNNIFRGACYLPINVIVGASREQLNKMYRARNFLMYNFGFEENMMRYGQPEPYEYPLENVFAPIALFTGPSDRLADPDDVQSLRTRIRDAIVFDYEVPQETFKHLDFVVGHDATAMVHEPMIALVQGFNEPLPWPAYFRK
ncbi:hypothetical protein V5799_029681 [Amblyomma americanum]|uniref:Triacylglycerol lipase n=1 Tax=Amblyomma americanum TaxID=6943 RepID=A0AAQ4EQC6_AMBAM